MSADDEYGDAVLSQMAAKLGGVQPLLEAMFGFLHRRTDFYHEFDPVVSPKAKMGFPKGAAERIVQQAFLKFPFKSYEERVAGGASSADAAAAPPPSPPAPSVSAIPSSLLQLTAEGKQVPMGNGGIGPNYYWTQTLNDVTVYIDVATGTRGKDVACEIKARDLQLSVVCGESTRVLISGSFEDAIRQDESMWTINISSGAPQIVLMLEKTRKTWWKHVIVGHPEIDTGKVDSTQRISEYDESTQAAIRKIMAEQQDKRRGEGRLVGGEEMPLPPI